MGRILQIQVRAWTYDEDEVSVAWPLLTGLVWPQNSDWPIPSSKHGVMDLVQALPDAIEFGNWTNNGADNGAATWPKEIKTDIALKVQEISITKKKIENALADWQPVEANRLSDQLEDQLTALEHTLVNSK